MASFFKPDALMQWFGPRYCWRWTGILAVALLTCLSGTGRAQISVDGPADAVRIEVVNAPLRDVLGALQSRFGIRFNSNDALDAVRTAKFHAPLRRVVARLLEGYDFVIAETPGGVSVLIMRQSSAAIMAIPRVGLAQARASAPAAPVMSPAQFNRPERD